MIDKKILLLNGINLDMLSSKEEKHYSSDSITLKKIEENVINKAKKYDFLVILFQSNNKGDICKKINTNTAVNGIIINARVHTHTSIAIIAKNINPQIIIVKIHLSNIFKQENFKHNSYISIVADAVFSRSLDYRYICP